jgi:hypothetical protein
MPLVRVLVLALALSHVVGIADFVFDDACEQACQDDDCGKDCMPGTSCRCHCPSAMPAIGGTEVAATVETPHSVALTRAEQRDHANPDPLEILRVPKHAAV